MVRDGDCGPAPLAVRDRGGGGGVWWGVCGVVGVVGGCWGGGGPGAVGKALDGPWGVAVELEGLVDSSFFGLLPLGACGDVVGASGEGSDGGTLVS
jgi:hypothetical protein